MPRSARDCFPCRCSRSGWSGHQGGQAAGRECSGSGGEWVHPLLSRVLAPNPPGDSHPHPVEIDLPPWILSRGIELRRWLFSHGSAIRIEAPEALRLEQQGQALEMLALGQRR